MYFCPEHALQYLQERKTAQRRNCKLYYTHSKEEISAIIKSVNQRLDDSDEEDSSTYEPPKQQKKHKSSGKSSGSGLSRGVPEPKNSETFPSSMWPAGMTAQQVNKKFLSRIRV